jgi:hypothetical protein
MTYMGEAVSSSKASFAPPNAIAQDSPVPMFTFKDSPVPDSPVPMFTFGPFLGVLPRFDARGLGGGVLA